MTEQIQPIQLPRLIVGPLRLDWSQNRASASKAGPPRPLAPRRDCWREVLLKPVRGRPESLIPNIRGLLYMQEGQNRILDGCTSRIAPAHDYRTSVNSFIPYKNSADPGDGELIKEGKHQSIAIFLLHATS